jgi:hypothetical protein
MDHLFETHFPDCEPPTEETLLGALRIISEDKIRWEIAGFGPFEHLEEMKPSYHLFAAIT